MKIVYQHDKMDCAPACLTMICDFYGKQITLQKMRELLFLSRDGVSVLSLHDAAVNLGFDVSAVKIDLQELNKISEPCILFWNQNHFVVLNKIIKNKINNQYKYSLNDPAHGKVLVNSSQFEKSWCKETGNGIAIFLEPNDSFYNNSILNNITNNKISILKLFFNYFKEYKKEFFILIILLLLGSIFTFILPFLTKELIDNGVIKKNIKFVLYIISSQIFLFSSSQFVSIFRNWLMLSLGNKISIKIISDFLRKMLKLPLVFFDTKMMGDFRQRIQDNERIEQFLTSQSLLTFFSFITFLIFSSILFYFNYSLLLLFISLSIVSILWSFYFMKKRKILDFQRFQMQSENQELFYEIFNGVTEMKLNDFQDFKRNNWETLQYKLFGLSKKILKIDQIQNSGFEFINQIKNILISFISAYLVIINKMTMGELLTVSFIVGQMNSPISLLIIFFNSLQDAKLSLDRIGEVENIEEEEQNSHHKLIGVKNRISLENVSFQYEGPKSPYALYEVSFDIPLGKKTAIVGSSGSGKTTLLKLLLKFYNPTSGNITIDSHNIKDISPKSLRSNFGVVLQDGYIFSDTIKRNIILSQDFDELNFNNAIKMAMLDEYVNSLPLKFNTKIGAAGSGISGGQKQRILIARAIYKNPEIFIFDEATSSLDSRNERIIYENLKKYLKNKTSIVIAHRLSTVKDADQIIVLSYGKVVEVGNHEELVKLKGHYYNLVSNQLELSS